jgi:hypothetical protein
MQQQQNIFLKIAFDKLIIQFIIFNQILKSCKILEKMSFLIDRFEVECKIFIEERYRYFMFG